MSCASWEADLVERARGGPTRGGLDAHLAACPRCAARLAEERALSAALAAAAAADAETKPPERVAAAVLASGRRKATARPASGRLLLAAAAALVAAALPLLRPGPVPEPGHERPRSAFLSLPSAEPLRPGEPAQLVRVGLSATALQALGWPVPLESGGLVETELILGSDGTARAMRLATVPARGAVRERRTRGGWR